MTKSFRFCIAILIVGLVACDSGGENEPGLSVPPAVATCTIPTGELTTGAGKDVIPALSDPAFFSVEEATYLIDEDRVIGFVVDGQAYAVPHNVMWFHEIVNARFGPIDLAVTYCPLTGSSMAFDREVVDNAEFRVSGLLWRNNLVMFDVTSSESLWPQMSRRSECGPRLGGQLKMYPVQEVTWEGWKSMYPETLVLTNETGTGLGYSAVNYPYGNYESPENDGLLFDMEIDDRRLPKERILGIPDTGLSGFAFPFFELDAEGPVVVVQDLVNLGTFAVFWDRAYASAMAFNSRLNGETLRFSVVEDQIVDDVTGSVWRIDGTAVSGPLAGQQLEPIAGAYVSFWFAWAAFHPDTRIWQDGAITF